MQNERDRKESCGEKTKVKCREREREWEWGEHSERKGRRTKGGNQNKVRELAKK